MTRNMLSACQGALAFTAHTRTSGDIGRRLKLARQRVTYSGYTVHGGNECSLWHSAPV